MCAKLHWFLICFFLTSGMAQICLYKYLYLTNLNWLIRIKNYITKKSNWFIWYYYFFVLDKLIKTNLYTIICIGSCIYNSLLFKLLLKHSKFYRIISFCHMGKMINQMCKKCWYRFLPQNESFEALPVKKSQYSRVGFNRTLKSKIII